MKNNLQGVNSKVDEVKNQVSDLEYKEAKNTPSEQQEEKRMSRKHRVSQTKWMQRGPLQDTS